MGGSKTYESGRRRKLQLNPFSALIDCFCVKPLLNPAQKPNITLTKHIYHNTHDAIEWEIKFFDNQRKLFSVYKCERIEITAHGALFVKKAHSGQGCSRVHNPDHNNN